MSANDATVAAPIEALPARPVGWALLRSDGTPVHVGGRNAELYLSLATACAAEEAYRRRTKCRAIPTPLWSRIERPQVPESTP